MLRFYLVTKNIKVAKSIKEILAKSSDFLVTLQPQDVKLKYFKFRLFDLTKFKSLRSTILGYKYVGRRNQSL